MLRPSLARSQPVRGKPNQAHNHAPSAQSNPCGVFSGGPAVRKLTKGWAPGLLYSNPCSIFSWQLMQCFAQGTASSRFCCISS